MKPSRIIAIDGPAGAGKGTIARHLATYYQFKLLESGLLYRLLAYQATLHQVPLDAPLSLQQLASTLDFSDLKDPVLRQESIGNLASKVSLWPEVRQFLTGYIRHFCQTITNPYRGIILDGRDIGTVVYPNADLKFFITANPAVRAHRRSLEMQNRMTEDRAYAFILERDQRDQTRQISPLTMASDAHLIDTTDLSIEQSCAQASKILESFLGNSSSP